MHKPIHSIHIITKSGHQQAKCLGEGIQAWLRGRGCTARIVPSDNYSRVGPDDASLPDMVLILGGDGTLLRVAGRLSELNIPLLGINFGRVGFLTELTPEDWETRLGPVLDGVYRLSPRLILKYELHREQIVYHQGRVINDLVIGRSGLARLVRFSLWHGQELMGSFRADGLIVATPVGSTAYAAAAGGPLISPELEVMEICPVCPFMSGFRPLVLPSHSVLTIQVESSAPEAYLTMDGQSGCQVLAGDRIVIREAQTRLSLIEPKQSSYITQLQRAGYMCSDKV